MDVFAWVDGYLPAVLVGMARLLPLVWFLPVFGGRRGPAQIRVGIAFALSVMMLPVTREQIRPASSLVWTLVLAREFLLGSGVGVVGSTFFRAAELAGVIADTVRGASQAEVLVPLTEERPSVLGAMFWYLAMIVFLSAGGVQFVLNLLVDSYRTIPIDPHAYANMTAGWRGLGGLSMLAVTGLMTLALGLVAPVIVAVLLAEVCLGLLNRVAPQIPVYFEGLAFKTFLGLGTLFIGTGLMMRVLQDEGLPAWRNLFDAAFEVFR